MAKSEARQSPPDLVAPNGSGPRCRVAAFAGLGVLSGLTEPPAVVTTVAVPPTPSERVDQVACLGPAAVKMVRCRTGGG